MKYTFYTLLFLLTSCQPAEKTAPEPEPYLLYISNRGKGFDIYTNNLSGNAEKQLTTDEGWEWNPQFIISTHQVLFNSQDTAGNFAMRMVDSTGKKVDFNTKQITEFSLSPNGKWLAYTYKQGEDNHITIAPYDNVQDSLCITQGEKGYHGRVEWSLDATQLLFISDRTESNEAYIYTLSNRQTQQITNNEKREKYSTWSPDGKKVAITMSEDQGANDIYIINLEDLTTKQLTDTPINESEIAWSILGEHIAYHAKVDEKDDIFTINIHTKKVNQITHGEGYHGEPCWGIRTPSF